MSQKRVFPHEIQELHPGRNKANKDEIYKTIGGLISVGPKNMALPTGYKKIAEDIYNFEPREDDVWIATFPRSGTTVTQELIWLVANDMDYEAAKEPLSTRFPYLEHQMFLPDDESVHEKMANMTSRRFIKTHLTFNLHNPDLFSSGSKVIYLARNPKDVVVSFYHFHNLISAFSGEFIVFFYYFINDAVLYASYWDHILQGWEKRNEKNCLFLFYEDLRKDTEGVIKKVAEFLAKSPTEEQIKKLKDHLDINNFKKNTAVYSPSELIEPVVNGESFIRKGQVRNWEKYLSEEMNETVDRLIKEKFEPVGLKFDCC